MPDVFPKLTAAFRIDANTMVLQFGADNFLNVDTIPSINTFDPNVFPPPPFIPPGFTPVLLSITVDPTLIPTLKWFLGCQVLTVDTADVATWALAFPTPAAGPPGDTGPQGPPGAPGPPGPPGTGDIFPSPLVHRLPRSGVLTVVDPNVTATSVILLQYVGGKWNPSELIVADVQEGQFTARGGAGRQFRYVIFH